MRELVAGPTLAATVRWRAHPDIIRAEGREGMNLRTTVLRLFVAALTVNGAAVAAAQDAHEVRVGSTVNITTCVTPSLDEDDEFVLTNIVDMPAHPAIAGKVIYWVSEVKKIRDFVGRRIQFDATIKDVDRKEIEVKVANANGNGNGHASWAEIELVGNQVKTAPETIGLSSAQEVEEVDIPATLVKLKLHDTPRVVSGSCDASVMRTAAVSSETLDVEARAETETVTAVTETARTETVTAVTEPARVEAPAAAEVEVAAAVGTPSAVLVEEVELEAPAPVVEAPETEAAAASIETTRTELPMTATPLPLILLLGIGSLGGATALRLRRK